jgi:hypothetical protein
MVVDTCHPRCVRGINQRIMVKPGPGKNLGVAQVVECLPSKCKALNLNPSTSHSPLPLKKKWTWKEHSGKSWECVSSHSFLGGFGEAHLGCVMGSGANVVREGDWSLMKGFKLHARVPRLGQWGRLWVDSDPSVSNLTGGWGQACDFRCSLCSG